MRGREEIAVRFSDAIVKRLVTRKLVEVKDEARVRADLHHQADLAGGDAAVQQLEGKINVGQDDDILMRRFFAGRAGERQGEGEDRQGARGFHGGGGVDGNMTPGRRPRGGARCLPVGSEGQATCPWEA